MAEPVKDLTHWRRRGRDVVRSEHTREVVREQAPPEIAAAMMVLADALDTARRAHASDLARIERLEAAVMRLAVEARKGAT